jgi:hypothetical protein
MIHAVRSDMHAHRVKLSHIDGIEEATATKATSAHKKRAYQSSFRQRWRHDSQVGSIPVVNGDIHAHGARGITCVPQQGIQHAL